MLISLSVSSLGRAAEIRDWHLFPKQANHRGCGFEVRGIGCLSPISRWFSFFYQENWGQAAIRLRERDIAASAESLFQRCLTVKHIRAVQENGASPQFSSQRAHKSFADPCQLSSAFNLDS